MKQTVSIQRTAKMGRKAGLFCRVKNKEQGNKCNTQRWLGFGDWLNNLRYADDSTLMAESEEELKSLLMKAKEESEKAALKLNIQQTTITASGPITAWL